MLPSVCYVILSHADPRLVARLAKLLLAADGLVAIHYDLNAPAEDFDRLRAELGNEANRILWPARVRVGWGEWSIIEATLNALEAVAASGATPDFVHLMSGSDYPIRPLEDFRAYLARHKHLEHIECVDMFSETWVKGGLTHERYAYRHFFNWKKHPTLFDRSWHWQQRLGLGRRFVSGLQPYMGSQWWTLSWGTARKVLAAGRDRRLASFFKTVWIPDEMFVQSVVAGYGHSPETAPILTLYQFTDDGVPVVYYNDHAEYLARQPFFFARKMSPLADRLRDALDEYVSGRRATPQMPDERVGVRTNEYSRFLERAKKPPPGVRLLGYETDSWRRDLIYQEKPIFAIFGASADELRAIAALLNETGRFLCHGALFHPDRIEFANDTPHYAGYSSTDIALRDDSRQNFLYAVAAECPDDRIVAFLAPWTMDDHIRDRLLWCSFSRILVVRGNVVRAFLEQLAPWKKLSGNGEAKPSAAISEGDPFSARAFADFYRRHAAHHEELVGEFRSAGTVFQEIDLMRDGCMSSLIEYLQVDGPAAPALARTYRATLTRKALSAATRPLRDTTNIRALVDMIPKAGERRAHFKDLARSLFYRGGRLIAICGASMAELEFVGDVLQQAGVASRREIHRPLNAAPPPQWPSGDDNAASDETPAHCSTTSVLLPWREGNRSVEDFACWVEGVHIVLVRGNVFRAYDEYAASSNDSAEASTNHCASADEIRIFSENYEEYYADIQKECKKAKTKCLNLDLMSGAWLRDLLACFRADVSQSDDQVRQYSLSRMASLADPVNGRPYQHQIVRAIQDETSRQTHSLALWQRTGDERVANERPVSLDDHPNRKAE